MKWFRFYSEAVDDPKVQKLPAKLFKLWVNLLCISSMNDGEIPEVSDLSFRVRIPLLELTESVGELVVRGLLIENNGTYAPHNWKERQYSSDDVTARVRRHRDKTKRYSNVSETASETAPDTDTDTDTDQKQKQTNANACAPAESAVLPLDDSDALTDKPVHGVTVRHSEAVRERWFRESFWTVSWAKIGVGAAKSAWLRKVHTEADRDKLIAAAIRQGPIILQQARDRGGSVLHPATWINQERYEDDMTALTVYSAPRAPPSKADRTAELFAARMAEQFGERKLQ